MRLGILDWGIGGLDCLRRIRARCPHLDIIYVSDAGFTPYGRMEAGALAGRVSEMIAGMNANRVVVACNAASAVLHAVEASIPVEGVIGHGVSAALATKLHHIGVMGGRRTIEEEVEEEVYGTPLRAAGCTVVEQVAQALSGHVEAGCLHGEALDYDLRRIMAPLGTVEGLILGCTHYPALETVIRGYVPNARIIDPVEALVQAMVPVWHLDTVAGHGLLEVRTTGPEAQMRRSAKLAFGVELPTIGPWEP